MSSFEMMRHAFPSLQAHIEDIVAARDEVAARVHPWYPHAASPRIADEWICSDMATLFRQLRSRPASRYSTARPSCAPPEPR